MKCKPISFFGLNYKLSEKTIENISKSTKLTKDELFNMSLNDQVRLMEQRGSLKKANPVKNLVRDLYKKLGETTGLLEKKRNI